MTEEEQELKRLIKNCGQNSCPLYCAFYNQNNAQSQFRNDQFNWSSRYMPPKFKIGEEVFGAKLVLIMESPPPKFEEFFYNDEKGGIEKEKGLFSNLMKCLSENEMYPMNRDRSKQNWLRWFAGLGIVIVDGAKCRMKISNGIETEKISSSQIKQSFLHCSEILKLQLQLLNPFRVAIGIASNYDTERNGVPYVCDILNELGNGNAFINQRTISVFDRSGPESFNKWFGDIWLKVKKELAKYEVENI